MGIFKRFIRIIFGFILVIHTTYAQEGSIKIGQDLELVPIGDHGYIHISYHDLGNYPNFPANGFIMTHQGKGLIIDTPWTNEQTSTLIRWLKDSLRIDILGVVVTHWHRDCMGGLQAVHQAGILSYSHALTREIAQTEKLIVPKIGFQDFLKLQFENKHIICYYVGPGHTVDNIVVWMGEEKILFGGCMVKALSWRGLGNTRDADLDRWPTSLKILLEKFPQAKIVIPGHGEHGDLNLVHHTLQLFQ